MGKINGKFIIADSLVIDFDTHKMWNIDMPEQKEEIKNTPYSVLETMWLNKNTVLSKDQILTKSWGPQTENYDSVVKDNISKINNMAKDLCPKVFDEKLLIENRRGSGYIIDESKIKIESFSNNCEDSSNNATNKGPQEFTQNVYGGLVINSPGNVSIIEHVDTINNIKKINKR